MPPQWRRAPLEAPAPAFSDAQVELIADRLASAFGPVVVINSGAPRGAGNDCAPEAACTPGAEACGRRCPRESEPEPERDTTPAPEPASDDNA
jgi:hypothetical protein